MEREYAGSERRRFKRVRADFLIVYKVLRPWVVLGLFEDNELIGVMDDISEGGAAMVASHNIPPAANVLVRFSLVDPYAAADDRARTIEITGDVLYNIALESGERRLGVCFTQIAHDDRSAIADYVKKEIVG